MEKQMLVREVHLNRGCFSRPDDADVEPTLVCPLCAMEGKVHPRQRTATLANTGHIWCHRGCGRYSMIVTRGFRGGECQLYPCELGSAWNLSVQTKALSLLKPALEGKNGDVRDFVTRDDFQPEATVGFRLPKLVVDQRAIVELATR